MDLQQLLDALNAQTRKVNDLLTENERLRTEIARLRGALEAVEWVQDTGNGDYYCPWCDNNKLVGHHADCQRQTALDAAGGGIER